MIELYYYTSPNARKALMMLEEVGLPYEVRWTDITRATSTPIRTRDHRTGRSRPWSITMARVGVRSRCSSPVPSSCTWRRRPVTCFRRIRHGAGASSSGCSGRRRARGRCLVSSALRQSRGEQSVDVEYAVERYRKEAWRLHGVLDARLAGRDYIVDEFSIADIAAFPWVRVAKGRREPG